MSKNIIETRIKKYGDVCTVAVPVGTLKLFVKHRLLQVGIVSINSLSSI